MNCNHCNAEVNLNYCSNCGQAVNLKRINGHYILHEIEHVLHFEKGILYTFKELLLRPGLSIRYFLTENRSRLVKPIIFIIITSLIYTLVNHFFHIEDGYVNYEGEEMSTTNVIFKWIKEHYGYSNIFMGVFIAFWLKVFFRKSDYNLFELLIMLCFVMGMGMLIFAVFALFQGITHVSVMSAAGGVGIAYCTWAIGQFYDKTKIVSYIKAFAAYMLGTALFFLTAMLIGYAIDLIIKH
jgi:hypothetical protein